MTAPAVPGERPGGWVDGIGWVAPLHELPLGTEYAWFATTPHRARRMVGDAYTDRRLARYPDNGPAIVFGWPDGSTPEPPAPQPEGMQWVCWETCGPEAPHTAHGCGYEHIPPPLVLGVPADGNPS